MPLKSLDFLLKVTFNTFPVQSSGSPGYTDTMDKVYIVAAGEAYESEQLVSVHASLQGALDAARELAHSGEDGIVYSTAKEGSYEHGWFWKALSGHYIAVQAKPLSA